MGADLSRIRLNALLDFAGVELKQGGVLLDADANEATDIVDRRLRALASDVLGRATVSATTPDAFKIAVAAGTLQIGKGRLYVDGLLAENHGARTNDVNKRVFDDLLGEAAFADPVPYATQPYFFTAPPALPNAGKHLVYLDVWNREVTHLERPELVERAVGVETSSRVQTVWQVRVLAEDTGQDTTCATKDQEVPGWATVIAPSSGVLTTGTFDVPPANDPCELPNIGGYRGLENQLFRVEIHDPGQLNGTATFKWSRENASVGSVIASVISATQLELPSLGRDEVLRFNTGDWVEIIDDVREFSQKAGEIRRITVDEATRRATFAPALPNDMLPGAFPNTDFPATRHLRMRRWDQKGKVFRSDAGGAPVQIQDLDVVGSSGVIKVPAAGVAVLLENGLTVSFATTGPKGFRAGDYWVFAARTADASVEILDRAPPRGIHHHYARLGIWDVAAGTVTDCRNPWPPRNDEHDCSCTACVTPDSHTSGRFTIQDAVNRVKETGGTVCLGPGTYPLKEPVRMVDATSVRIRGQGPNTIVVCSTGGFVLENCVAVAIENLTLLSLAGANAIAVQTAIGLTLRQLVIALVAAREAAGVAITFSGIVAGISVRENAILAPVALASLPAEAREARFVLTAAFAVDDNLLWCQRSAVRFTDNALHLLGMRVSGNEIVGCQEAGVSMLGLGGPGSSLSVHRNSVTLTGDGIRCGVDGAWICDNKLVNNGTAAARRAGAVGISLMAGLDRNGSDQCQILANQISGFITAGIRIGTPTRALIVKLNIIENCGNGIVSTDDANGGSLSIENNQLRNIGGALDARETIIGIGLRRAETATVAGNVVRSVGVTAEASGLRAGILLFGVTSTRIFANDVAEIAPPGDYLGTSAGVMIRSPFLQFDVSSNHVQRDTVPSAQPSRSRWNALVVADATKEVPILREGGFTTVRLDESRTVVLGGGRPFLSTIVAAAAAAAAAVVEREPGRGSVVGNTLLARGPEPAVDVRVEGECLFNDNRVEARLNRDVAVLLTTTIAVVSANRVRGGETSIKVMAARQAAVLGNITTGLITVPNGLQDPWDKLNLRG